MTAGRPSDYTEEMANNICMQLIDGLSLREICRQENMPSKTTVFKWTHLHKEFADQYARAREQQGETFADEIIEIADDSTNDYQTRKNENGEEIQVVNPEAIGRSRLRVDTRKWIASKILPKKYGDLLKLSNPDLGPLEIVLSEKLQEARSRAKDGV